MKFINYTLNIFYNLINSIILIIISKKNLTKFIITILYFINLASFKIKFIHFIIYQILFLII
jgi:hypothetical protein